MPPSRIEYPRVPGAEDLFTPEFQTYLELLHDRFTPEVRRLRDQRDAILRQALEEGRMPGPLPESEANTGDWKLAPLPEDLQRPGIEISGPVSVTGMFINALNPGPDGTRAEASCAAAIP